MGCGTRAGPMGQAEQALWGQHCRLPFHSSPCHVLFMLLIWVTQKFTLTEPAEVCAALLVPGLTSWLTLVLL